MEKRSKFYKKTRIYSYLQSKAGALCLLLAISFVFSMLPMDSSNAASDTLDIKVKGDLDLTNEALGFDISPEIVYESSTKKGKGTYQFDVKLTSLSVQDSGKEKIEEIIETSPNQEGRVPVYKVEAAPYSEDDGSFSFVWDCSVPVTTYPTKIGERWYYTVLKNMVYVDRENNKDRKTFYKVVYEDGSDYTFDNLETSVKKIMEAEGMKVAVQGDQMISNIGEKAKIFQQAMKEYLENLDAIEYASGTKIPLYKDGKSVKRIDVLTYYEYEVKCHDMYNQNKTIRYQGIQVNSRYSFLFDGAKKKLKAPEIATESGKETLVNLVKDDTITLSQPDSNKSDSKTLGVSQYYLSANKLTAQAQESIKNWETGEEDKYFSPNNKNYLYVRSKLADTENIEESSYMTGDIKEYQINYMDETNVPLDVRAHLVDADGNILDDTVDDKIVDVGDTITLSFGSENPSEQGVIVYTQSGGDPKPAKLDPNEHKKLKENLDAQSGENYSGVIVVEYNKKTYIKLNGLWYVCDESTQVYNGTKFEIGEEIYQDLAIDIHAQALVQGKEIGKWGQFLYRFEMRKTVTKPEASPSDKEMISMGTVISFGSNIEQGSRIFYTLNGSSPVVKLNGENGETGTDLILGEETFEYKTGIVIDEQHANYGGTITLTAQAVHYCTLSNGQLRKDMKDSPVVRFIYKIEAQTPIKAVSSIPETTIEKQAEVRAGDKIGLYCETEDSEIFYTLDGSEPKLKYDEATKKMLAANENTKRYDGNLVVPQIGNSSLFTITAVATNGVATSDITRLIFHYPAAVPSPYASPAEGSVTEGTDISLRTVTEGAVIYYEIAYGDKEPGEPSQEKSNVFDQSSPIRITKKTTIKACCVKNGVKSTTVKLVYEVSDKLKAPTASVESGAVLSSGTQINLKADTGASIHFTVDGSDPKKADNKNVQIGETVIINGEAGSAVTVKTYASKEGFSDSDVAFYSYSISSHEGGIYADKVDGSTVKNGDIIHLETDVSGAKIYRTTDGSTPTTDSNEGGSVTVSGEPGENFVLKAVAVAEGTEKTISTATFTYKIMEKLTAPSADIPDGAVFTQEGVVTLSAESGKIYYTTNGEEPSTASNLYRTPITVNESMTLKAVAVAENYEKSETSTFSYGFADQVEMPKAKFDSGELNMGQEIEFSCATEGALIYYRTDGTEPSENNKQDSILYTGPIMVEKATTFKVIALKEKMRSSKVLTVGYTVREPVVLEEPEEEEPQVYLNTGERLQSRRSYSGEDSGPSFSDVVLRNATFGTVLSADEGVLPEGVQLKVQQTKVSDSAEHTVKQVISESYGVVASYDLTLLINGEETQPEGEIEIGLPIPADYENSLLRIVHIQEDGTVEVYDTRRSSGMAYAKVGHLSVYSIAAPVEYTEKKETFPWRLAIYCSAVVMVGVGFLLFKRARKLDREDAL